MESQAQAPQVAPQANQAEPPQPQKEVIQPQKEITSGEQAKAKEAIDKLKKEPAKDAERFEIKVNGKVKSVTRDELIRMAQLSEAANERFNSAAQKEKMAQKIIEGAKKNPIEALMDPALGLTKEQVRSAMEEWYTREFIEPTTLTEEQRRLKQLEIENARYKEVEAQEKARLEKEAQEKEAQAYVETFQKQIIEAIEEHKLPKTKSSVRKIAFYMRQAMEQGFEAPMELVVQRVREDRKMEDEEIKDYTYEDIIDRFGKDFVKKIIAEDLKRIREKRDAESGAKFGEREPEPRGKKDSRISMREAAQRLKAMRTGR